MTRPLTPGAYLKARRTAAGLSVADVALQIPTEPRVAAHLRADWIEAIEADVHPARFTTIAALRCAFAFDLYVLECLELIRLGAGFAQPHLCRICACSEADACGEGCWWAEPDLCSSCATATA